MSFTFILTLIPSLLVALLLTFIPAFLLICLFYIEQEQFIKRINEHKKWLKHHSDFFDNALSSLKKYALHQDEYEIAEMYAKNYSYNLANPSKSFNLSKKNE